MVWKVIKKTIVKSFKTEKEADTYQAMMKKKKEKNTEYQVIEYC